MHRQDLDHLIASIRGATFASLDTVTEPTIRGGHSNPFVGRVAKHTLGGSVILFTNQRSNGYENMVRRRLEQEGIEPDSFVLGERPWGIRIPDTPYVTHNGKMYLECIFLRKGTEEYRWSVPPEHRNGLPPEIDVIPKEYIIGLKDRTEAEQGGLTNKVNLRVYRLDSIQAIRLMGEEVS